MATIERVVDGEMKESFGALVLWIEMRHTWASLEPGAVSCWVSEGSMLSTNTWTRRLPLRYVYHISKYMDNPTFTERLGEQVYKSRKLDTVFRHALVAAGMKIQQGKN